jgi:hypothetical protein
MLEKLLTRVLDPNGEVPRLGLDLVLLQLGVLGVLAVQFSELATPNLPHH